MQISKQMQRGAVGGQGNGDDEIALQEQALNAETKRVDGSSEEMKKPWVDRTPFSVFMGMMIFCNSILVALETDYEEARPGEAAAGLQNCPMWWCLQFCVSNFDFETIFGHD